MPPKRAGRQPRTANTRANRRANGAAAPSTTAAAHQYLAHGLLLAAPAVVRTRIYDHIISDMRSIFLDTTKPTAVIYAHPLAETNRQIRSEFVPRALQTHRVSNYIVEVKAFDSASLMTHMRSNNRLSVPNLRVTIWHNVTSADIDRVKLDEWVNFVRQHSLEILSKVSGMPPVAMRRVFMSKVIDLKEDFEENESEGVDVLQGLEDFWARGKGEMTLAKPGEKPPGGPDWTERDAGTDVDSSGDEENEDNEPGGDDA